MFPDKNFVRISHLSHACYIPRPTNSPCSDRPNNISEAYKLYSFSS
jgi:hypothetical protein